MKTKPWPVSDDPVRVTFAKREVWIALAQARQRRMMRLARGWRERPTLAERIKRALKLRTGRQS